MIFFYLHWCAYILLMAIYTVYSVLRFISKPGTTKLFPVALIVVCGLICVVWVPFAGFLGTVAGFTFGVVNHFLYNVTAATIIAGALIIAAFVGVCWAYVYLSRFLAMLLGIFPPITRPLMPVAPLKARRLNADLPPVPVRRAVPPLPPRQ